jgi:hypothetical protein
MTGAEQCIWQAIGSANDRRCPLTQPIRAPRVRAMTGPAGKDPAAWEKGGAGSDSDRKDA